MMKEAYTMLAMDDVRLKALETNETVSRDWERGRGRRDAVSRRGLD